MAELLEIQDDNDRIIFIKESDENLIVDVYNAYYNCETSFLLSDEQVHQLLDVCQQYLIGKIKNG